MDKIISKLSLVRDKFMPEMNNPDLPTVPVEHLLKTKKE